MDDGLVIIESPRPKAITGIGFVTSASNVPSGYIAILRTKDNTEEADLWRDGLFARKTSRFLCYTHKTVKHNGSPADVLIALALLGESESSPSDKYIAVPATMDTHERALKRKLLYAQFVPRHSATLAVTQIAIYGRGRRPGANFVHLGDLNSLSLWLKATPVAECEQANENQPPLTNPLHPIRPPPPARPNNEPGAATNTVPHMAFATTRRGAVHPLSGVPFEISKRYAATGSADHTNTFENILCKTLDDIEAQYNYNFIVENSLLNGLSA